MGERLGMTSLRSILIASARAGTALQRSDGSFPPGHNGPWNIPETPVRNTSHWLITCAKAYELTQDISFKEAVENAGAYLLSSEARPFHFTFHILERKEWATNGLVGQAWVIEALIAAYKMLENEEYLRVAHELVLQHWFNKKLSLWHITTLTGEVAEEHKTLNQQIWFTALAHKVGIMTDDTQVLETTTFSANNFNSITRFNGKFIHMRVSENIYLKKNPILLFREKWRFLRNRVHADALSKGYLTNCLYPLALLHAFDNSLIFWNTEGFNKSYLQSIRYMDEYVFKYSVEENPYAFSYHPTGFEAAFIAHSFERYYDHPKTSTKDWVEKQIDQHFSFKKQLMCRNTCDPITLSARIYEATRLVDLNVEIAG